MNSERFKYHSRITTHYMTKSTPNALLVKPKIGKWTEIRAYLAHEFDALDVNHQLYAPENFILGLKVRLKIPVFKHFEVIFIDFQ